MASIVFDSRIRVLDDNGDPVSGAKIRFFDAGTTTPRTVYTDKDYTTAHEVPINTDSDGLSPLIFINPADGDYSIEVKDANDVSLRDADDDLSPNVTTPVSIAQGGTGATSKGQARTNLEVPSTTVTDGHNTRITALESTDTTGTVWGYTTQTFATSFTPDLTNKNGVETTLTDDMTVNLPSNGTAGKPFNLRFKQDSTGSRDITLNAGYKPQSGSIKLTWSTSPNAVDVLECQYISATEVQLLGFITQDKPASYIEHDFGTYVTATNFQYLHQLGETPREASAYIKCTTAEHGYTVGQYVFIGDANVQDDGERLGLRIGFDDSEIRVQTGTQVPYILTTAGVNQVITAANWKLVIRYSEA